MSAIRLPAIACLTWLPVAVAGAAVPAPEETFPRGTIVERVACSSDPSQTYSLYLPPAYSTARRWPVLLVFDPRGRGTATAEIFRGAAERYGWIVMSSNDTRSDAPSQPTVRAVQAMWADIPLRVAADERRLYAAGFSGTAAIAWELGTASGQLAGVIAVGGQRLPGLHDRPVSFAVFGAAGQDDFNFRQMKGVQELVARYQPIRRFEIFAGEHAWLPPALAEEAIAWFEVVAMRDGRRPRDEAFLQQRWQAELEAVDALLAGASLVRAQQRLEALARSFDGLVDTTAARTRLAALSARRELTDAVKDERRWDAWEERTIEAARRPLGGFGGDDELPMLAEAENRLRLPHLRAQAAKDTYEGHAARRVLNWMLVQTSFYMWRDHYEAGSYQRAAYLQQIAARIDDSSWAPWVRLALTHAKAGDRRRALAALENAVDRGLDSVGLLDTAQPFASLREDPAFQSLRARVAARAP